MANSGKNAGDIFYLSSVGSLKIMNAWCILKTHGAMDHLPEQNLLWILKSAK